MVELETYQALLQQVNRLLPERRRCDCWLIETADTKLMNISSNWVGIIAFAQK